MFSHPKSVAYFITLTLPLSGLIRFDDNENINSELQDLLNSKDIKNYDLKNPVSKKIKDGILRPFIFKNKNNYCLITELKNTNTILNSLNEKYELNTVKSLIVP